MKKALVLFCVLALFMAASCKKVCNETMKVVRDCTGTYLQYKGKDYQVCNFEKLDAYADGVEVKASFKKIENCNFPEGMYVCLMAHESEGLVEVTEVE